MQLKLTDCVFRCGPVRRNGRGGSRPDKDSNSQCVRVQDVVDDIAATESLGVEDRASPGKPQIGLVGEDAKEYATAGDIRHRVRYGLGHGVDCVRPYRVPNVDDEVGHDVGAARDLHQPHDEVLNATAEPDQHRILLVRHLDQ